MSDYLAVYIKVYYQVNSYLLKQNPFSKHHPCMVHIIASCLNSITYIWSDKIIS